VRVTIMDLPQHLAVARKNNVHYFCAISLQLYSENLASSVIIQ
jgi:hypothetical protein